MGSFSCIRPSTIAFRLGYMYVLFYQFCAKTITFFDQEKFGTAAALYVDVERFAETDVKMMSRRQKCQNNHTDVMHESRLTPLM